MPRKFRQLEIAEGFDAKSGKGQGIVWILESCIS